MGEKPRRISEIMSALVGSQRPGAPLTSGK